MTSLGDKLEADGYNVVQRQLVPEACSDDPKLNPLHDVSARKLFEDADVILPLSRALRSRSSTARTRAFPWPKRHDV